MEQTKEPGNIDFFIWLGDIPHGCGGHIMGKGQSLQQMLLENWISTFEGMKSNPYTKLNSKKGSKSQN